MEIKRKLKNNYLCYKIHGILRYELPGKIFGRKYDIAEIKRKYKKTFGKKINLDNPKTLNEKLFWLMLNEREDFHTIVADKYEVRKYWQQFGSDGLISLLYQTYDWHDIKSENLPNESCIVKFNSGSGSYEIIRDKNEVNYKKLRNKCRIWMAVNFYYRSQEWQYKNIKHCIIVEKLLLDKNGHIPNNYKLHYINGKLEFVYCSVDREGENYRIIYSPDWVRMDMEWVGPKNHKGSSYGADILPPPTFNRMKEIGSQIAQNYKYVRVDFYDLDGKLYYGEITLHHGGGLDTFEPEKWDLYWGNKLKL